MIWADKDYLQVSKKDKKRNDVRKMEHLQRKSQSPDVQVEDDKVDVGSQNIMMKFSLGLPVYMFIFL